MKWSDIRVQTYILYVNAPIGTMYRNSWCRLKWFSDKMNKKFIGSRMYRLYRKLTRKKKLSDTFLDIIGNSFRNSYER